MDIFVVLLTVTRAQFFTRDVDLRCDCLFALSFIFATTIGTNNKENLRSFFIVVHMLIDSGNFDMDLSLVVWRQRLFEIREYSFRYYSKSVKSRIGNGLRKVPVYGGP